jgi:hypothetical protein
MGVVKLSTAGILDYSKTSNFLSGNSAFSLGAYDLLETTTLTTSASSISFTGLDTLAAGYQHLQIRAVARSDRAAPDSSLNMRFNGDSGSNYQAHSITTYPGYFSSGGTGLSSSILAGTETGGQATANTFGASVIDILDFASSKNTTIKSFSGYALSNYVLSFASGLWINTNPVTSITVGNWDSASHVANSCFSLYGVK